MNLLDYWPVLIGIVTLVIVLSKMHAGIAVLDEKVKVHFDLVNKR